MAESLAGGAGVLVAGRVAVALMGWTGTLLVVRALSARDWGSYSLVFSVMGLVGLLADLRLGRSVLRDLQAADSAPDPAEAASAAIGSYLTLRIFVGLLAYTLALVVVWATHQPDAVVVATIVGGCSLPIVSMSSAVNNALRVRMWLQDIALAAVLGQVAQLAMIIGLVAAGARVLLVYMVPAIVFELVVLAWKLRTVRGRIGVRPRWQPGRWVPWLKESAPLSVGSIFGVTYLRVDTIILSKLADLNAVGIYAAGYRFSDLLGNVSAAVVTPVLVTLTRAWPDDREGFHEGFRRAFVLLSALGALALGEFGALARPMITTLYGNRFAPGAGAAVGLVGGQVIQFYGDLFYTALVAAGRNVAYPLAALVGLVVNVSLNIVLIPRHSYNGAAVATVISAVVVVAIQGLASHRLAGLSPWPWAAAAKSVVAGAVCAASAFVVTHVAPWPVAGLTGLVAFLVVLHVTQVDGPGGLRALRR